MLIAEKLRKSNIAEYLLYMWQVEDLLRAFGLDFDKLKADYLSRFSGLADDERQRMEEWLQERAHQLERFASSTFDLRQIHLLSVGLYESIAHCGDSPSKEWKP